MSERYMQEADDEAKAGHDALLDAYNDGKSEGERTGYERGLVKGREKWDGGYLTDMEIGERRAAREEGERVGYERAIADAMHAAEAFKDEDATLEAGIKRIESLLVKPSTPDAADALTAHMQATGEYDMKSSDPNVAGRAASDDEHTMDCNICHPSPIGGPRVVESSPKGDTFNALVAAVEADGPLESGVLAQGVVRLTYSKDKNGGERDIYLDGVLIRSCVISSDAVAICEALNPVLPPLISKGADSADVWTTLNELRDAPGTRVEFGYESLRDYVHDLIQQRDEAVKRADMWEQAGLYTTHVHNLEAERDALKAKLERYEAALEDIRCNVIGTEGEKAVRIADTALASLGGDK